MDFNDSFRDKTVWVSGHTGFKGSWLCEWLLMLGARVHGYALEPPTEPALFDQLALAGRIGRHQVADIRDSREVAASLAESRPDFVFHLAAQSLVRGSYLQPAETFAINSQGTVNVLEGLRALAGPCVAVMVTTDKVYENREWVHGYREGDPLGGHDPYSASKAAAEIAIASYRRSFFSGPGCRVRLASARAGNVIGGGDWATDRIVPDCIRSIRSGRSIPVRSPRSTRPWQHVLEPLSGYLTLASAIEEARRDNDGRLGALLESPFNFGPDHAANRTVAELVDELSRFCECRWHDASDPTQPHEAGQLHLSIEKAFHHLGWSGRWSFEETIRRTAEWYSAEARGHDLVELTQGQIRLYGTPATASSVS